MQGAREEIGEMMVKILREGAQMGDLRRERGIGGIGKEAGADSGRRVEGQAGLSDWERLSQWNPDRGSFAAIGSNRGSLGGRGSSKSSKRRGERQGGRRRHRSPWVKSKIW